jgi:hypothetical protein
VNNLKIAHFKKLMKNVKIKLMKKSILNIGKTLNKVEQKEIFGGWPGGGPPSPDCRTKLECEGPYGNLCPGECVIIDFPVVTNCYVCDHRYEL